jgi:hypothetical protein
MLGKTDSVSVSSWNNMVDDTWGYTRRVAIRPNKPSAFVVELPVSVVAWHFPDRTECRRFFQSAQPKNFPCPPLLKRDNKFYRVEDLSFYNQCQFSGLEPRLTRQGYNAKVLADVALYLNRF